MAKVCSNCVALIKKNTWAWVLLPACFFKLLSSCHTSPPPKKCSHVQLTQSDADILTQLFYQTLLEEVAIYTLFGSKPMTIAMSDYMHFKPQSPTYWEFCNKTSSKLNKQMRDSIICKPHDALPIWEKVKAQLHMTNFCVLPTTNRTIWKLQESIFPSFNCNRLIFINKESLISVIVRHYSIFKSFVGEDFSVKDAVEDIENWEGVFWTKIWQPNNTYTQGILLGYGENNAKLYSMFETMPSEYIPKTYLNTTCCNIELVKQWCHPFENYVPTCADYTSPITPIPCNKKDHACSVFPSNHCPIHIPNSTSTEAINHKLQLIGRKLVPISHKVLWQTPKNTLGLQECPYFILVNKPNLYRALTDCYPQLKASKGQEFSIKQAIDTIEDEQGIFWQEIWQPNSFCITKTLLGATALEAYITDLGIHYLYESKQRNFYYAVFRRDRKTEAWALKQEKQVYHPLALPLKHISLPRFACADDTYEYYALERDRIAEYFQKKNFLETVLDRLQSTGDDHSVIIP